MDIPGLTGITGASVNGAASTAGGALADDFDKFLLLLTTQLQHQDPLNPMDTTEFTNQLVQFASVEQQIAQNGNLEELITLGKVGRAANAVSFLGTHIEAPGDTTLLEDGLAEWRYVVPSKAASINLIISDAFGRAVFQQAGEAEPGTHTLVWNGAASDGSISPDGSYSLNVVAEDESGEPISVITSVFGRVTGIETIDDEVVLFMGDQGVQLDKVFSIQEPDGI